MKKLRAKTLVALATILSPALLFAEGNNTTIDTTAATTAVTELKTKVSNFLTGDMMQAALAIIGAAVVIWLLFIAWKLIKKAGAKAG